MSEEDNITNKTHMQRQDLEYCNKTVTLHLNISNIEVITEHLPCTYAYQTVFAHLEIHGHYSNANTRRPCADNKHIMSDEMTMTSTKRACKCGDNTYIKNHMNQFCNIYFQAWS